MIRQWTSTDVLQLASSYQAACILAAAADLDLFTNLAAGPFTAAEAAAKLDSDARATTVLLDALSALALLDKSADRYSVPPAVARLLTSSAPGNVLAMAQHQANCMRRWVQLAKVVKTGHPADREPSIRGEAADYASFIEAMDNVSAPNAPKVVADLQPLSFAHLLDVGGGSGTWTLAFLATNPTAAATIFDLPHVMPQARERIARANLEHRIHLVPGDYLTEPLPAGADLAFLGAIVHSNSRQQNRALMRNIHSALVPGGRLLLRDIIMESSRTTPTVGALFAINMLTGTEGGGTYTFDELREDLESAGFTDVKIARKDEGMNAVISALKPS